MGKKETLKSCVIKETEKLGSRRLAIKKCKKKLGK